MPEIPVGIKLELKGFDKFVSTLEAASTVQENITVSTDKAAASLTKFEGVITNFVKGISGLSPANLDTISRSLNKFSKAFIAFSQINLDATALQTQLGKMSNAITSSAQAFDVLNNAAKTIPIKSILDLGEAVRKFTFGFNSLLQLKGFEARPLTVKLQQLSSSLTATGTAFSNLGRAAANVQTKQLEAFGGSLKIFGDGIKTITNVKSLQDLVPNIQLITNQIQSLQAIIQSVSNISQLSASFKLLGESMKALVSGFRSIANIKFMVDLELNIKLLIDQLYKLQSAFAILNKLGGTSKLIETIAKFGEAIRSLASGFRTVLNIKNFNELPMRIQLFVKSLENLQGAFRNIPKFDNLLNDFDKFAKGLQRLAAGIRSVINIKNIGVLPQRIQDIINAMTALDRVQFDQLAVKLQKIAGPLKDLATAARSLTALKEAKKAGENMRELAKGLSDTNIFVRAFIFNMQQLGKLTVTILKLFGNAIKDVTVAVAKFSLNTVISGFKLLFNVLLKNPLVFLINLFSKFIQVVSKLVTFIPNLAGKFSGFNSVAKATQSTVQQQAVSFEKIAVSANKAEKEFVDLTATKRRFNLELSSTPEKLTKTALALGSLTLVANGVGKVFSALRNQMHLLTSSTTNAIITAENLELQLSVLQARELVNKGEFDDFNAAMETAQERTRGLITEFKILAQRTPFETNDIVGAFKQLQTFGFITEDAKALVSILALIPGISGDALKEIAVVLGQIRTSGKLSQQDLRQLTDRDIAVGDAFQRAFQQILDSGEASGELLAKATEGASSAGKAIEIAKEGWLSANDAVVAIASSIQKDFSGSLELSAATLDALSSSLRSLKDDVLNQLFSPAVNELKPFLAGLVELGSATETATFIKGLADALAINLKNALITVKAVINSLIQGWNNLSTPTKNAIIQGLQFTGIVTGITIALALLQGALTLTAAAFVFLVNPVSIVVGVLTGLTFLYQRNKEAITNWVNASVAGFQNFANAVQSFIELLFNDFDAALTAVVSFGSGLISAFVDGIISAFGIVVKAMQQLGNLIAVWLRPNSPPKILPEIDQWGTDAANIYLEGFAKADFDTIRDFGGTVNSLFKSLKIEGGDTSGIVNLFAGAIDEINSSGSVDLNQIFGKIDQLAPEASNELKALAQQYIDVALQTKALEKATNEYGDAVNELNNLEEKETLANEEARIKSLTNFTKSQFITEQQRQKALDEIAKIQSGQLIRQAEKQLEQSEADLDKTKAKIDLANEFGKETKDSTNETDALGNSIDKAAKAAKNVADELESMGAGDILGGLSDIDTSGLENAGSALEGLNSIIAEAGNPLEGLFKAFEDGKNRLETAIKPIKDAFKTLKDNAQLTGLALATVGSIIAGPKLISAFKTLGLVLSPLVATVGLPALALGLFAVGAGVIFANTAFGSEVISTALTNIGIAMSAFEKAFTLNDVYSVVNDFVSIDLTSVKTVGETLGINASIVKNNIETFATNIYNGLSEAYALIQTGVNPLDALSLAFTGYDFETTFTNIKAEITKQFNKIVSLFTTEIPAAFETGFNDPTVGDNIANKIRSGLISAFGLVESKFGENNPLQGFINNLIADLTFEINNSSTLSSISAEIQTFFGNIKIPKVESIFTAIGTSLGLLLDNLTRVQNVAGGGKLFGADTELEDLIANIGTLVKNIGTVTGAIAGFVGLIGLSIIPELPGILNNVVELINGVIELIVEVTTAIGDFLSGNKTFTETLQTIFNSFSENFGQIFNAIDEFAANIVDIFDNMIEIVQNATGVDLSGLQGALDTLRPIIEFLISGLVLGGIGKFLGIFGKLGGTSLIEKLVKFKTAIVSIGTAIINAFTLGIVTNIDKVKAAFEDFIGKNEVAQTLISTIISIKDNIVALATDILAIEWTNPFEDLDGFVDDIVLLIKTILSTLQQIALDIVTAVLYTNPFVNLEPFIQAVIDFINDIFDTLNTVATTLGDIQWTDPFSILTGYVTAMSELIGGLTSGFSSFVTSIAEAVFPDPFGALNTAIETTVNALNGMIELLNKVPGMNISKIGSDETSATELSFEDQEIVFSYGMQLVESAQITLDEFSSIVAAFEDAGVSSLEGYVKGFDAVANSTLPAGARDAGKIALDAIKGQLGIESPSKVFKNQVGKPVAEGIIVGFKDTIKQFDQSFSTDFMQNLTDLVENVLDIITTFSTDLTEKFTLLFDSILLKQSESSVVILESLANLIIALIEALDAFYSTTTTNLSNWLSNVSKLLNLEFSKILVTVTLFLNNIINQFKRLSSEVIPILNTFVTDLRNALNNIVKEFENAAKESVNKFAAYLDENLTNALTSQINTVVSELYALYVTSAESPMKELGDELAKALVDGIAKGIYNRIKNVITAIEQLIKETMSAGKATLESRSPSKLTQREWGEPMVDGMIVGIENQSPVLMREINALFSKVSNTSPTAPNINTGTLLTNESFDTRLNNVSSSNERLLSSLLNGIGNVNNDRTNNVPDKQSILTTQSNNSFVRTTNKAYNLYLNVDENRADNVKRNFRTMEFLGV